MPVGGLQYHASRAPRIGSRLMATVVGVSFFFHDSAAALVRDGRVVAAAAEERFSREKHASGFPKYALQYCLDAADIASINDVDAVVFYEKPLTKFSRVAESLVRSWPRGLHTFATRLPAFLNHKVNIFREIERALPGYAGEILFSDHHLSHATAAFCGSPFSQAAIITVDGVGESETTTIGVGDADGIRLLYSVHFPHSIGLLYSAITAYLGFRVNDGEWKVMGLAPYGRPRYLDRFRTLVAQNADGSFALELRYFVHTYSSTSIAHIARWTQLFGLAPRHPDEPMTDDHRDFARSGQALVEELLMGIARAAQRVSGSDNLVIGGGVGLNSVANWKIEASGIFRQVWVHPAPGDDGGALGAALAVSRYMYADPPSPPMTDAHLGPAFPHQEVTAYLDSQGESYEVLDDAAMVEAVADMIADGKIVGWCRGRMEFGPRALGARSILGNAADPEMKTRINARVKFREYFRPFAPSVPLEHVHEYFDVAPGTELPFMVKVPLVREDKRAVIPAVTHADGSGRVQTVTRESNEIFHRLLLAVGRRTGVPVVVNTSFNVRGEPMVCSPADAYQCFRHADLDALVLEGTLIRRTAPSSIDADAGYAISDRLERQAADSTTPIPYSRIDHFRFANAIDSAAHIRKGHALKALKSVHERLSRIKDGRVLQVLGSGLFANQAACHYAVTVTGVINDDVVRRHAAAVARMIVGKGSVTFASVSAEQLDDRSFDMLAAEVDEPESADLATVLNHFAHKLRPGGLAHLAVPHGPSLRRLQRRIATLPEAFGPLAGLEREGVSADAARRCLEAAAWSGPSWSATAMATLVQSAGLQVQSFAVAGIGGTIAAQDALVLDSTEEPMPQRALRHTGYGLPGWLLITARGPA